MWASMDVIHILIDMVYTLFVTLYAIMYENYIVDICSSLSILFSLTNLFKSAPSTFLVDSAYPFL
jgi:hypothetical protein